MNRFWLLPLKLLIVALCLLLLNGCQSLDKPSKAVLVDALQMQINITHDSLKDALNINEPTQVSIKSANIENSQLLDPVENNIFKFIGVFDYQIQNGKENFKKRPFLIYMKRGDKGESWRLAKKIQADNKLSEEWVTYSLPIE